MEGTRKPKENIFEFHDKWWLEIKKIIPIATEVSQDFHTYNSFDFIWTPARQMQNYTMLKKANKFFAKNKPKLILKRHFGCTIDEVIGATSYLKDVKDFYICERGIVTFDRHNDSRWRPDIMGIVELKKKGFKVIFDPSHSTGNAEYVIPMSKAALAAGADGLLVEVHYNPKESLSDKKQALDFGIFRELMQEIKIIKGDKK